MLPSAKRLSTLEFKVVIEKGAFFHSDFILLRAIKTKEKSRFAVSVPKKVAKTAVLRNKIRRRVYSAIGAMGPMINLGFNAILIMKSGVERASFEELASDIRKIFVKSGIIK
ncbi:MAG TPA: ribonuclease P protein component [Candidatus Paceibacterota bacterium]